MILRGTRNNFTLETTHLVTCPSLCHAGRWQNNGQYSYTKWEQGAGYYGEINPTCLCHYTHEVYYDFGVVDYEKGQIQYLISGIRAKSRKISVVSPDINEVPSTLHRP